MPSRIEQIQNLLHEQRMYWPMLRDNYSALASVRTREIDFNGFKITAQFNPARLLSTGAKLDARTIAERKCFLCRENLSQEQDRISFGEDYAILCNPFPIFRDHLTIPHNDHRPQRIADSFGRMLDLTRDIGERFVVFYNGPACGASAPDHMHFQAGEKGFLPLERDFETIRKAGRTICEAGGLRITAITDCLCSVIALESKDDANLQKSFARFCDAFSTAQPNEVEPMMNILATAEDDLCRVLILPRIKHRPAFYFAEEDEKILLSPASVDLGGVCILPVEAHFLKLTLEHLKNMSDEVCLKGDAFEEVISRMTL